MLTAEIISPEGILFSGKVLFFSAPGTEGSFGILRNHVPFCSALKDGIISLEIPGIKTGKREFKITGGFVQVYANNITALVETDD
jgi:F-type H+-transporting ATPase subunit epsilon